MNKRPRMDSVEPQVNFSKNNSSKLHKELLSDRDELKLIERIISLRESYPNIIVGEIQRPLRIGGVSDGVFEVEVEY